MADKVTKQKNITATKALSEYQQSLSKKKADRIPLTTLFRVYLIPLIVVSVFAAVVFGFILPGVGAIFEQLDKTAQTNLAVKELDGRLQRLQALAAQSEQTAIDTAALNVVIPEAITEVVNFQQQVRRLMGEQNGLTVGAATTAEQAIASIQRDANAATEPVVILQIPTTFTGTGTIQNIRFFIEDIKSLNSFVVIGEMTVSNSDSFTVDNFSLIDTSDKWQITITLIKYQFATNAEARVIRQLYIDKSENATLDPTVLEYIRTKAK